MAGSYATAAIAPFWRGYTNKAWLSRLRMKKVFEPGFGIGQSRSKVAPFPSEKPMSFLFWGEAIASPHIFR